MSDFEAIYDDEMDEIDGVPIDQEVRSDIQMSYIKRTVDDSGYVMDDLERHEMDVIDSDNVTLDVVVNKFKRFLNAIGYTYVDALIVKKCSGYLQCDGYETEKFDDVVVYKTTSNSTSGYVKGEVM